MSAELDEKALQAIQALQRPGKPDLLSRIVGLFNTESPKSIEAIQSGVEAVDLDAVRAAAHALKSSSAYLGATDLSVRCRDIEQAARDGNFTACLVLSEPLMDEFESIRAALEHYLKKAA